MRRDTLIHGAVAAMALGLTGVAALRQNARPAWDPMTVDPPKPRLATVADAQGRTVPSADYRRIVVCHGGALLHQLAADERIAAVSTALAVDPATAWCFGGRARVSDASDGAAILALRPDLLIAHAPEAALVARCADHGCRVFDPGVVDDLDALERVCLSLGALLQVETQADKLVTIWQRRRRVLALHAVHPPVLARQTLVTANETARLARLASALGLAGVAIAADDAQAVVEIGARVGSALPNVSLAANALLDPLGSDLLDVATAVRTQLAPVSRPA